MSMSRSKRYFALVVIVLFCSLSGSAPASEECMPKGQLVKTIAEIKKGNSISERTKAAQKLNELTSKMDPKKVDDKTLEDLVLLLDIPEDPVRAWVAAALGNLGPRAKIAVPKLLQLFAKQLKEN